MALRATAPAYIRCDNGPELTANALRDWCRFSKAGSAYIEPGSPWQNPYVESFGSRVRDELLSGELFETLLEAQVMVSDWREDYNERRPHSALGMTAPATFAKAWREDAESARPITLADTTQARRTPQDAPTPGAEDRIHPDQTEGAPQAAPAVTAIPLPTMKRQPTTNSHNRWTDERGPATPGLGGDYFQRRDPEKTAKRLIAQLQRLGHTVTLEKVAA